MTKLRSHVLALYVASLVFAGGALCAPAAAAAPAHHMQAAGHMQAGHSQKSHAHEAAHGGHGSEAPAHDCGIDETACACAGSSDGVLPVLTARDGGADTGLPAPLRTLPQPAFAAQGLSSEPPPERRRRPTHSYDEIYGLTGRMLI
ncbi:MAG: hypothetical protein RH982_04775 [Parvibaculum sp.]